MFFSNDTLTQKAGSRVAAQQKSQFFNRKNPYLLSDYPQNIDQLKVFQDDGYLVPFKAHFQVRYGAFLQRIAQITKLEECLENFANGWKTYGLNVNEESITYREWAPGAQEIYLIGDFNSWDRKAHPLKRDEFGNWEIQIPHDKQGNPAIPHNSKIKAHVLTAKGEWQDRIPVWSRYNVQDEKTKVFDAVFWNPKEQYEWKNQKVQGKVRGLKVYEVHIGMAGIEERVHTYKEFTTKVLPRVHHLGYNAIEIMAIAEHAYYGSFGYHVTNLFGVSSRFGTPDDFKELVDEAHKLGIRVIIDIVHSHASSNVQDGFNMWDGTDYQYFHGGDKGNHPLWDSKVYDYSKYEVLRLLLSNLSYWSNEYRVDGFRFDGITSTLYHHHGAGTGFTGNYQEYFNFSADIDAMVYLTLANELIKQLNPDSISIAEDVSGYPTLCRPVRDGGLGFDYRMAMAVPDQWIEYLKKFKDEDWDLNNLVHTLTNRRYDEKCIAYVECHDQALVGDQTISMWLFDSEIYTNMSILSEETPRVWRGMALHKMLRLLTMSLAGEGYLTFMGNEFGHPEWIDFPRLDNNWSYHYCRRRWDLVEDKLLRFQFFNEFDREMIQLDNQYVLLDRSGGEQYISEKNEGNQVLVFEKGDLLFVFNFHPTKSFTDYKIGTRWNSDHELILDTDKSEFGGHNRLSEAYKLKFPWIDEPHNDRPYSIKLYIPNRCAMVLLPENKEKDLVDPSEQKKEL